MSSPYTIKVHQGVDLAVIEAPEQMPSPLAGYDFPRRQAIAICAALNDAHFAGLVEGLRLAAEGQVMNFARESDLSAFPIGPEGESPFKWDR